jgi:class 3 adenylate cyclase
VEARTVSAGPGPATSRRGAALAAVLTLPLLGLALLIAEPGLDARWEHHPAHFWLVLAAGALNAGLAYATGTAARRRGDARVFLVSLAFLAAAGFLGLHALATPGVLLAGRNAGFAMATPVGLVLAGLFAAASSAELGAERSAAVMRRAGALRFGLVALMAAWAVASLAGAAPLDNPAAPERASGPFLGLAVAGLALYGLAVGRYLGLHRRRPAGMLVGVVVAFTLLAEAMVAVAFGRNWHATWWEWHVLMLIAFGLVAWSAHRQWHEERFSDLYLEDTTAGTREVSVLFADLEGFTSFSELHPAHEVSRMLNEYFDVAIPPIVDRHGGEIDRIIGDALMVTFNRRGDQPDHAGRAARAALAIQEATAGIAVSHPGWPRFRVGVNSGQATVSVLGTAGGRTLTVIGDTVNVAARLQEEAPVGGVAIGPATARLLRGARTRPLGPLRVKGRTEPVHAHSLLEVAEEAHPPT